jgi:predicted RNA binding protein YcfA (HicA-like mRNA interferase family)
MPMTPKQMIKLLKESGFIEERQNGSHKFFVNPVTGKRTITQKTLKKALNSKY